MILRLILIVGVLLLNSQGRANDITLPLTPDSNAFNRVIELYNQGHLPEWADFDPSRSLQGKGVYFYSPNQPFNAQLISLESGDEIIGSIRRTGFFNMTVNGSPLTIEMGQQCLDGRDRSGCLEMSPLVSDTVKNAFLSSPLIPESTRWDRSASCSKEDRFRKVVLSDGKEALVSISVQTDTRIVCNPNAEGQYLGSIRSAGYVLLP